MSCTGAFTSLNSAICSRGRQSLLSFIVTETLCRPDVFFHHGGHFCLRHRHRLFEQHLNEIGVAGTGAFFIIQIFCWNTSLLISFPPFLLGIT